MKPFLLFTLFWLNFPHVVLASSRTLLRAVPHSPITLPLRVAAGADIGVRIALGSEWKLNERATSWLALFSLRKKGLAPVAESSRELLAKAEMVFPKLFPGEYRLQGLIYYCRKSAVSFCVVQGLDQKIEAVAREKNTTIEIVLNKE